MLASIIKMGRIAMSKLRSLFSNKPKPDKIGIIIAGIVSLYILFQIGRFFFVMFIFWADLKFSKIELYFILTVLYFRKEISPVRKKQR